MAQTGEMTFWDHLEELRGSLFRMLGAYAAVAVVLFFRQSAKLQITKTIH